MFDLETSLGSLFSLGWRAAWKAAANDVWAFERLKNDADWHGSTRASPFSQRTRMSWLRIPSACY